MATDCPISNRYSPLLHRLENNYREKGIRFLAVFSATGATMESVRQHLADYSLEMPGLVDAAAVLARQTGARVTPEAVVLSPAGVVLYRGRIDNQYVAWGQTRSEATRARSAGCFGRCTRREAHRGAGNKGPGLRDHFTLVAPRHQAPEVLQTGGDAGARPLRL